jgi:Arc/MetJ-type ribon-helix-helix transcriptional regulator
MSAAMSRLKTITLTVRVNGALRDFVAGNVGGTGDYENVSEYLRDLIRSDKARTEQQAFRRLKAELAQAFAAPEASYEPLTADDIIRRNRG